MYAACGASGRAAVALSVLAAPGLHGAFGGGLAFIMLAIAISDARTFIIPDALVLAALALGLLDAALAANVTMTEAIAIPALRGIVLGAAFWSLRAGYRWLRGREGIGLGDVKLAAVAGVWLDWLPITFAVELAALAALAAVAVLTLRGRQFTAKTRMPFGCFFAPAIWLVWLLDIYVLQPLF
jgi:leader peptidase (prepilin peptidase)/N-methyltransferase